LREALAAPGPAVVQAAIDPNEPPMPGKIATAQAWEFAKAGARREGSLGDHQNRGREQSPRSDLIS
jgi:hypothetical protein